MLKSLSNKPSETDVERYFKMAISFLSMPIEYENKFELDYVSDQRVLVIEYFLPTIDDIPKAKEMIYDKNEDKYVTIAFPDSHVKQSYNTVAYQIVLAIINYVFKADSEYGLCESIVFNGQIEKIDVTSGRKIQPYILSIKVLKEEFTRLDLSYIDAQSWFFASYGLATKDLSKEVGINPIIKINSGNSKSTGKLKKAYMI